MRDTWRRKNTQAESNVGSVSRVQKSLVLVARMALTVRGLDVAEQGVGGKMVMLENGWKAERHPKSSYPAARGFGWLNAIIVQGRESVLAVSGKSFWVGSI